MTFRKQAIETLKTLRSQGYELRVKLNASNAALYDELSRLEAVIVDSIHKTEQRQADIKLVILLEAPCCPIRRSGSDAIRRSGSDAIRRSGSDAINQAPSALAVRPTTIVPVHRGQRSRYQAIVRSALLYKLIYTIVYISIAFIIPTAKVCLSAAQVGYRVLKAAIIWHVRAQLGHNLQLRSVYLQPDNYCRGY